MRTSSRSTKLQSTNKYTSIHLCQPTYENIYRTLSYYQNTMTLRADLDHIALECRDSSRIHSFYRDILQFEHMQMPNAPFPSVRVSDITIIDFMQSDGPKGLRGANHICFSVSKDALDGLKARLTEVGIEVDEPKARGGARGRGWSIYFRDPEENMLEFRYYA